MPFIHILETKFYLDIQGLFWISSYLQKEDKQMWFQPYTFCFLLCSTLTILLRIKFTNWYHISTFWNYKIFLWIFANGANCTYFWIWGKRLLFWNQKIMPFIHILEKKILFRRPVIFLNKFLSSKTSRVNVVPIIHVLLCSTLTILLRIKYTNWCHIT